MRVKPCDPVLYSYLVELRAALQQAGETEAVGRVTHVCAFGCGSATEFFTEAEIVLKELLETSAAKLSELERMQMRKMIEDIAEAFRRIGGA